jgi:hypothetical protein
MRFSIAAMCASLVFYGTPALAEPLGTLDGARVEIPGQTGPSGLARSWPPPSRGIRLAQVREGSGSDDIDARIADLRTERERNGLRGPRIGLIAGGIATTVGAGLLVATGISCRYGDSIFFGESRNDDHCKSGVWDKYWVAGGILSGVGLVALSTSAILLSTRSKKRKVIDRQILDLQRGRTARVVPSWNLGADVGERKALHVGWRF